MSPLKKWSFGGIIGFSVRNAITVSPTFFIPRFALERIEIEPEQVTFVSRLEVLWEFEQTDYLSARSYPNP